MANPTPSGASSPLRRNSYLEMMNNNLFEPDDIYIAVMGVTGAGKTTFISKCVEDAGKGVEHSLESETQAVSLHTFHFNRKKIHLVNTPEFDDTYRLDSDVLKDLAYWLSISYKIKKVKLTGIVYLHSITDIRMTGNAFKNLRTFRKLVGKQSMSSVILATTMWNDVTPSDGNKRESDLKDTAEFWGDMIREGSTTFRHTEDHNSAMNIISILISRHTTTVLGLQKEMVDEDKPLGETEAGREVDSDLIEQRELFERRLKDARQKMEVAIAQKDKKLIEEIAREQDAFQDKIDAAEKGRKEIQVTMEKLIQEKEAEHRKQMADLDKKLQEQEARVKKKEQEHEEYMKTLKLQREQDEKKWAAREAELDAAKERADHGDLEKLLALHGADEVLQEQKAEEEAREEKSRVEASRIEAEVAQERERLVEYQRQQALYQQAQQWQSRPDQAFENQRTMYRQKARCRHQTVHQAAAEGGVDMSIVAGAMMVAAAAATGMCCVM